MNEPRARVVRFSQWRTGVVTAILGGLTLLGLSSCTKKEGPVLGSEEPVLQIEKRAPALPPAAPERAKEPPPQPPAPDLFERGARHEFQLGTELLGGIPQEFSRLDLDKKTLKLSRFSPSSNLWLAVDHHAPRPARSLYFTISDLLNEDIELAPGSHYLVAFEWGNEGPQRLQLAVFFVEVEPTSLPLSPGCVLVTPTLTKNGLEAKEPLRFLAVPLVAGIERVEYRAETGELRSRGDAPVGTEMSWKDLPGGDVTLEAECFSGRERLGGDEQMVTLNPEAVVSGAQP